MNHQLYCLPHLSGSGGRIVIKLQEQVGFELQSFCVRFILWIQYAGNQKILYLSQGLYLGFILVVTFMISIKPVLSVNYPYDVCLVLYFYISHLYFGTARPTAKLAVIIDLDLFLIFAK